MGVARFPKWCQVFLVHPCASMASEVVTLKLSVRVILSVVFTSCSLMLSYRSFCFYITLVLARHKRAFDFCLWFDLLRCANAG
jgi:hypothetical protein